VSPASYDAERTVREILSEITLNENCLHQSSEVALETIGIDSVGMIELVYALEDRFSIEIADEEIAPENFASIDSLAALIARKCPSEVAPRKLGETQR
jgi:acyl carrier protein